MLVFETEREVTRTQSIVGVNKLAPAVSYDLNFEP
jgi:hypothetical protein